jgi:hypothetical protein
VGALLLKRALTSRPSGEWDHDDFDVLADGVVVGRVMKAAAAPVGTPWIWTLAFGHHEDRTPTHGYEPSATWPHRRCRIAWPNLGERRPSRLVATALADCLSNSHLVRD